MTMEISVTRVEKVPVKSLMPCSRGASSWVVASASLSPSVGIMKTCSAAYFMAAD